tara:strand:- start:910 stop:1641 length:732 start_codon:yes stop_codon:yes gene_type:complete
MTSFVIPSFQRPTIFKEQTLAFLKKHNVDETDIHLFLRSDDLYLNDYMDRATGINIHITDVKGVGKTHNYITEHFDEDSFIVEIDDDLQDLFNEKREPVKDFKAVVKDMKTRMTEENISYGGTYQVVNPLFMSGCQQYTQDLRYMLGCLRFRFVKKDIVLETNYAEDFENSILHFIRDGKILKNNWIAPKTKNYQAGGCAGDGRDNDTERSDKVLLASKYPQYCRLFQRKNGKSDLRLKEYKQ